MEVLPQKRIREIALDAAETLAPVFKQHGWEWCSTAGTPAVEDIADHIAGMALSLSPSRRWEEGGRIGCRLDEGTLTVYLIVQEEYVGEGAVTNPPRPRGEPQPQGPSG